MNENPDTKDWVIVCRNPKCKHRYPVPSETPIEWKTQKFRGVCGHGEDTVILELKKSVPCPDCGEKSYRVIKKHFTTKTEDNCPI